MKRYKIITHHGKSIIHLDFSNYNPLTKDDLQNALNEARAEMAKYPPYSALVLADVTGLIFDIEILKMFKDYAANTSVKGGALVGINKLMELVLPFLRRTALSEIHVFKSKVEALDWLAEQ